MSLVHPCYYQVQKNEVINNSLLAKLITSFFVSLLYLVSKIAFKAF